MAKRKRWFRPITEIAREVFDGYLREFLDANPGWTKYQLLRSAGMDPALLNRIDRGATFSTASLDRLLRLMEDVVDGKIAGPSKPKPRRKVPAHGHRTRRSDSRRNTETQASQA